MLRHSSVVRPQCIWQAWTSRRRSTRQDLGMSQKLWKVATPMDGQFRPRCARCPGYRDRRCSNAWRASSHSIDVSAKVASKLPDWQKMAMQLLADVERSVGSERKNGILLDLKRQRKHQICSFMWTDNFWVMSHSKSHLEQMLRDMIQEAQNVGFGTEAGKLVVDKYL